MKFNRIIIRPYSSECGGARVIVKVFNDLGISAKRVYSKNYWPEKDDFILNWGASYAPDWAYLIKNQPILNHWSVVGSSINKIKSFQNFKLAEIQTPEWTTNLSTAMKWSNNGHWVCCRTTTTGYDGAGLILAKTPNQIISSPLYTLFQETNREYRAYIFKGELIDLLYKYPSEKIHSDVIRTETNGWEFGRHNIEIASPQIANLARRAIAANGLDFGGIDIIQGNYGLAVLETNSEPGIGLITARRFTQAIRKETGL